ncbi:hypothetical protein PQ478_08770 [Alkalihalophilus pseudofirmus]|uniref:hypothetical protein n=1 Tax=Alkalihalophilus pseudofirmus TaxID=79885 RepID=UPI00259B4FF3|nr:hypothetical protein [Alkalihalophilus pseudofirmus]WEG18562.1 hypothetical protein PQ478_08770 [Alkalihalophilus pseudofirmus]
MMNVQELTTEEMQEQIEDYNDFMEWKERYENLSFYLNPKEMNELMAAYSSNCSDSEFVEMLTSAMTTATMRKKMYNNGVATIEAV